MHVLWNKFLRYRRKRGDGVSCPRLFLGRESVTGKDKKNQKYDWKQGHFFWTVIKQVDISLQKVLLRLAVKMKVTFALQNNICRALHKKTQKVYILLKGLNCYFFPRDPEFLFSVLENFCGKQWVLTNLNSFFLN